MGQTTKHYPVKLVVSYIYRDEDPLYRAVELMRRHFGEYESLTAEMCFDYTDYYKDEFGPGLKRKLCAFKKLVPLDKIYKVKLISNRIEDKLRKNGRRKVNIDPGYITQAKLVLLTTKDYSHRIHVGNNIYAEVTLYYQNEAFRSWPWTYPDYASGEIKGYFQDIRNIYMEQTSHGS